MTSKIYAFNNTTPEAPQSWKVKPASGHDIQAELMFMEWPPVRPAVVLPQLEKWPSGDDVVSVEDFNLLTRPNRRPALKSCSRTMQDVLLAWWSKSK
tara:strand:+ start:346 stop:636 length:291 start_codon:yes stop_codon:yes gene_type:complete